MLDPQAIVAAFNRQGADIPIDWEHSTQLKGAKGEPAPAAGWGKQLEVRDGAIWARSDWTPRGTESINAKEYRYISPAFEHDAAGNITRIVSAGLTNVANLHLAALNSQGTENTMNPEVLKALGLAEGATTEEVLAAIEALKTKSKEAETALNRKAPPSLDEYVPRAQYDVALNRITTLEQGAQAQKQSALEQEIEQAIDAAKKAGKVTPATEPFYLATCRQEGGLAKFRDFIKTAPVVVSAEALVTGKPVPGSETALNAQQIEVAKNCGLTPEEFAAGAN